jgi:hypothetical protein
LDSRVIQRLLSAGEAAVCGVLLAGLTCMLPGCATIGPAVPKLSSNVGDRIAEMRSLHELAIRRMIDGERRRVDAFLDERWTPQFLRNYIGVTDIVSTIAARSTISAERERDIAAALKEYLADSTEAGPAARAVVTAVERDRKTEPAAIRRELDRFLEEDQLDPASNHVTALLATDDPARELLEWSRQAEIQIRGQRAAMHAPIDEAEEHILSELGSAYDDLMAAQTALTARVQAAAKVKEIQDDALSGLGVRERFEKTKQKALSIGTGVGRALEQLERLAGGGGILGTKMTSVLRDELSGSVAAGDSILVR